MSKRRECKELAAKHALGDVNRFHRSRAYEWTAPVWRLQGYVHFVGLALIGLGALFGPITAAALVAGALGLLFAHCYLVPVDDAEGRRWIALCDGGFVTVAQRAGPEAVQWSDIRATQHLPKRAHHMQFGMVSSGTRYPESYQASGTSTYGRPVDLVVRRFGRQRALVRRIERRATPHVLERAQRDLERTGHAAFGQIIVTRTTLIAASRGFEVPLTFVGHVGSRILSNDHRVDPRLSALSGLPTSRALRQFVGGLTTSPHEGDTRFGP